VSSTGIPVKLSRPLDFLVIADHAEGLGLMFQLQEGNPGLHYGPAGRDVGEDLGSGTAAERAATASDIVVRQGNGTLPKSFKDPKVVGPIMTRVAAVHGDGGEVQRAGKFSAIIGYEWTTVRAATTCTGTSSSATGRTSDQVFPFSSWNSEAPRSSTTGWRRTRRRRAAS